ncbi:DUF4160 domain-containing protein (plasmid) [Azospirillum oryzae]|uniref:DUF4160 domain-containing protein n=1 Tax=Azospirillum oryzae TaxID=286727 RepID=A0A6N1AET3_9PROT|nr:DUF4160 domain-containing protein [Azospirillum oryzae]KAA0588709.1 DUF4160 domain-containing protein [Azospirillum oryzae]QKS50056.1 DUF4160 domain-containing protein [Azospirillum oryzae]GLR81279.1 hypothetical protein GCM10007856_39630 [Azospirillum oryzae]
MGKLATIGKATIRVFGNDHLPPHFHVKDTDFEALVSIETFEVIAGDLPTAIRKEVQSWAAANKDRLVSEWNAWNPNIPFA